jgi:hypothetical protein
MTSFERFIQEQDRIIAEDKEKTLISLGIVEREYAPEGKNGWPYEKSDYINGQRRYYKEVAANVSDEEYAIIIEKAKKVAEIKKKRESNRLSKAETVSTEDTTSKVATILRYIVGITAAIAIIAALVLFGDEDTALAGGIVLGSAFVEGVLLWALAEILDRLTEIAYYTKRIKRNTAE